MIGFKVICTEEPISFVKTDHSSGQVIFPPKYPKTITANPVQKYDAVIENAWHSSGIDNIRIFEIYHDTNSTQQK